jgi:hypothetical protein
VGLVAAFLIVLKAALHQPPAAARTYEPPQAVGVPAAQTPYSSVRGEVPDRFIRAG